MKYIGAAILVGLTLSGCTDYAPAQRLLEGYGFTKIRFTGSAIACLPTDPYPIHFEAYDPGRKQFVKGDMCDLGGTLYLQAQL
jgi:hypothetical protein